MKLSKLASAMPFAHLLGLPGSAARAEEDDDRKRLDGESDDDYAKRMEEKDEKDEKARKAEEEEKEKARKAEEEKEKEAAKAKEVDDDEEGDAKADDDEDDESGKRAGRAKGARQRERVRCARIMAAGIKAGRVNQAGVFAFDTHMSASQAIAALDASGLDQSLAPRQSGLRERMSGVALPNVGADAGASTKADPNDPKVQANAIILAGKKRRGEI